MGLEWPRRPSLGQLEDSRFGFAVVCDEVLGVGDVDLFREAAGGTSSATCWGDGVATWGDGVGPACWGWGEGAGRPPVGGGISPKPGGVGSSE